MHYVIHHNPKCGTSRNVVSVIEAAGYQPVIIDYLKTGWTKPYLYSLFAAAGMTAREALREGQDIVQQLGLLEADISEEQLLEAMVAHPILVNRPIVCCKKGVSLCRPASRVLDLLDRPLGQAYHIEKGKIIFESATEE